MFSIFKGGAEQKEGTRLLSQAEQREVLERSIAGSGVLEELSAGGAGGNWQARIGTNCIWNQ